MRQELEDKLAQEFSFMRVPEYEGGLREAAMTNLYHAFGCECSDGWYQLIYDLCSEVRDKLGELGFKQTDFVVEQVKEKFGGLRFYYCLMNDDSDRWDNHNAISEIVYKYEELSEHTCEQCGKPGKIRGNYWLSCMCDDCYGEYQKKWGE